LDCDFGFLFFLSIIIDKECPHDILLSLWMHSNWVGNKDSKVKGELKDMVTLRITLVSNKCVCGIEN
jgi:hypothetical protein